VDRRGLRRGRLAEEQARNGDIPAIKLGRYWRFRMSEVEAWLTNRQNATYKRRTA
jgi:excisionase family DNA binding protein